MLGTFPVRHAAGQQACMLADYPSWIGALGRIASRIRRWIGVPGRIHRGSRKIEAGLQEGFVGRPGRFLIRISRRMKGLRIGKA